MREQRLKILAMMNVPSPLPPAHLNVGRYPPDLASVSFRPTSGYPLTTTTYHPTMMQQPTSQQLHDRDGELQKHREMWMAAMERRIQHAMATAGRDWEQQQLQVLMQMSSRNSFQYGHNPILYDLNHDPAGASQYPSYMTSASMNPPSATPVFQPVHPTSAVQPPTMPLSHIGTPVAYPGAVAMPVIVFVFCIGSISYYYKEVSFSWKFCENFNFIFCATHVAGSRNCLWYIAYNFSVLQHCH